MNEQIPETEENEKANDVVPLQSNRDINQPLQEKLTTSIGAEFKLERYKYILQEIHTLNEGIHKYLNLFQVLATAIIGAGALVFIGWQQSNISASATRASIRGLMGLLVIIALFLTISVITGAISWFDYRKEEVDLLNEAVFPNFRKPPTWKNFWRWNETYVILFVLMSVIVIITYVENQIISLIK